MTATNHVGRPGAAVGSRLHQWLWGLAIVVTTFLAYLPCLNGGFVWDDDAWTIYPRALYDSPGGLWRIWTDLTALQQYYPLAGTTFWIEHHLWGGWTTPYHVQNVLWHALSAVLFWRVLAALRVPGAWLAGGLFALHPVMVESVAWIAERKNVLSMALFLGAMLSYSRFAGYWEAGAQAGPRRYYWWALGLFAGALFAKLTAFVFAPTVLLICWWKRGRITRSDVRPLWPFFALSFVLGWTISHLEKVHAGAEGADWDFTFLQKFLHAGRVVVFYVGKLLWPSGLSFMYSRWVPDVSDLTQWLYPLAVVAVAIGLWCCRRRLSRGFFAGVFFFAGAVFPVVGFVNIYGMRFASVADHWVYLPSLGVFTLVAAGLARAAQRWRVAWLLPAPAVVLLPLFGVLSWQQAGQYLDMETLWLTTSKKNPGHWMPYVSLGLHYKSEGRSAEALEFYQKSLALNPKEVMTHSNIGAALADLGRHAEAVVSYRKALAHGVRLPFVHFNLGTALFHTGQIDEAILELREAIAGDPQQAGYHYSLAGTYAKKGWGDEALASYRRVIELEPGHALAHLAMGNLYLKAGRPQEAVGCYRKAVSADPGLAAAHANLGYALLQQGEVAESIVHTRRSLEIAPRLAGPHLNLGLAYLRAGRWQEALAAFTAASQIDPALVQALANAAWVLAASPEASVRNGSQALEYALRAERLTGGKDFLTLRALGAAYAESGDFVQAAETARRAIEVVAPVANAEVTAALQQDLERYGAGEPVRITVTP